MKIPSQTLFAAALKIANTYVKAQKQAQALGLTLAEWEQSVEAASVLIQAGCTPDEIEAAARTFARGRADQ